MAAPKKKTEGMVCVLFLKSGVGHDLMHAAGEEVLIPAQKAEELVKLKVVKILA